MIDSFFYSIGGFGVRVIGSEAKSILQLPNFEPFRLEYIDPILTIDMVTKFDDFDESGLLYSLTHEDNRFCCVRLSEGEYGFKVKSITNDDKLSIRYMLGSDTCVIGGVANRYLVLFALWLGYGVAMAQRGVVAIHTSVVRHQNKAVMFLGESGTGKSTHSRLWLENIEGTTLLNDDSPLIRVEDGIVYVYGSPWSGKTPCYRTEKVELGGVVRLSQAPHNKIIKHNTLGAFSALYPSCPPAFANDKVLSGMVCSVLSDVIAKCGVWHLEALPNAEAARTSWGSIFKS